MSAYLLGTPFGRIIIALKANEKRVPYLGYSTWAARMAAYVLAAVIAGLAGALYPMLRGFVSPELLFFATSGDALIMVIVGGAGTLAGAIWCSDPDHAEVRYRKLDRTPPDRDWLDLYECDPVHAQGHSWHVEAFRRTQPVAQQRTATQA